MHAAAALAHSALRPILDFALPPRCPGCGAVTAEPHRFCLDCWSALIFLGEPCCARCALPFDYGEGAEVLCGRCIAEPPAFDRLRAAVAYGEISRKVALKLKYGGRPGVAETIARFMQRHLDRGEASAAGAGAAAPLADLAARLQPVGADRRRARPAAGPRGAARPDRAGQGDAAAARHGAARAPARRCAAPSGSTAKRKAELKRQDGDPRRRRLYERRHRQCLRPGAQARRRGPGEHPVLGARCPRRRRLTSQREARTP